MLLYSWDKGLDVCVDLTVSSPLTQTGTVDFIPGRAVIDAAQRELETNAVILLKRIQKFSTTQDIEVVQIFDLEHSMNGMTYRCVLCYRLGVPLFIFPKPCSACSRVFVEDIYGDHVVSCTDIVGIKHRHNIVRDTLVDICFRFGISVGKEVDIGLSRGRDKPLLIEAAQRKRVIYEAKCAEIGYGFLPFLFSSLGELKNDAVTLLKRIQKFSLTQDIDSRTSVHILLGLALQ
nr:hypothetical protein [Tanacetum cinerariifolium]